MTNGVIDTVDELARLARQVAGAPWIAVDTEADSLYAYPERLCLLQISLPGADEVVDPLAGIDLGPLLEALRGRELLLHGADYDLRLLAKTLGFVPARVFDTMIAARLLGDRQLGLAATAERHLGVQLSKGSQKANWARRPLPEALLRYARDDTRHLAPLAEVLRERLERSARLAWHEESCACLVEDCARPRAVDPDRVWRLAGAERLDARGLAALKAAWHWREAEALAARRPPYFVVSHERLVEIAGDAAEAAPGKARLPDQLRPDRARSLRRALAAALASPPRTWPRSAPRATPSRRYDRARLDRLKQRRDIVASELGLEPTVVASRAVLERLAVDAEDPEVMRWQRALLQAAPSDVDPGHGEPSPPPGPITPAP
jgi:ribonuclease D